MIKATEVVVHPLQTCTVLPAWGKMGGRLKTERIRSKVGREKNMFKYIRPYGKIQWSEMYSGLKGTVIISKASKTNIPQSCFQAQEKILKAEGCSCSLLRLPFTDVKNSETESAERKPSTCIALLMGSLWDAGVSCWSSCP